VGVTIREATCDDADLLARLIRDGFRTVAARLGLTREICPRHPAITETPLVLELLDKGNRFFVLQEDGRACGCVGLERPDPETVHVRRLAVLPECRGRGHGRRLMEHALAEARRLGARRATLGVVGGEAALEQWYARMGFAVTERKHYDDLPFDVTFMAREERSPA